MHWVWFSHSSAGRAGPDWLLDLGDLSCARILYSVGAHQLDRFDRAAAGSLRETLNAFGLGASIHLGREFSGKLAEINLVLGIVKLALLVVAMVFQRRHCV